MQPRNDGYRTPMGHDRDYRHANTYAREYSQRPAMRPQTGPARNRRAPGGFHIGNPFAKPKTANTAKRTRSAPADAVGRHRMAAAVLSAVGIMSFFMGWISFGPMEVSGFMLVTGGFRGAGSPIHIYAIMVLLIGCASLFVRWRGIDNNMLDVAMGVGMIAMGALAVSGMMTAMEFDILMPDAGIITCFLSGIGHAALPVLRSFRP